MATTKNTSATRHSLTQSELQKSFAALIFCGKRIPLRKEGRQSANEGVNQGRRGFGSECPLTGKLISSYGAAVVGKG